MDRNQPFFSIVIPTRRRPRQLAECLRALSHLDYPRDRFEVIVVDDGGGISLDGALAPFKETLTISLLRRSQEGPSGARNAGAAIAEGDFLAFTADDCMPAVDWIRTLAACFAARPDCAFGGKIVNAVPG